MNNTRRRSKIITRPARFLLESACQVTLQCNVYCSQGSRVRVGPKFSVFGFGPVRSAISNFPDSGPRNLVLGPAGSGTLVPGCSVFDENSEFLDISENDLASY